MQRKGIFLALTKSPVKAPIASSAPFPFHHGSRAFLWSYFHPESRRHAKLTTFDRCRNRRHAFLTQFSELGPLTGLPFPVNRHGNRHWRGELSTLKAGALLKGC
jgi:hypothetical protein